MGLGLLACEWWYMCLHFLELQSTFQSIFWIRPSLVWLKWRKTYFSTWLSIFYFELTRNISKICTQLNPYISMFFRLTCFVEMSHNTMIKIVLKEQQSSFGRYFDMPCCSSMWTNLWNVNVTSYFDLRGVFESPKFYTDCQQMTAQCLLPLVSVDRFFLRLILALQCWI